jgi:hypothetical protein
MFFLLHKKQLNALKMVGITQDFLQTAFRKAYYFETGMKTVQTIQL